MESRESGNGGQFAVIIDPEVAKDLRYRPKPADVREVVTALDAESPHDGGHAHERGKPCHVTGRGAVPVSDSEVAVDDDAVWVRSHVLSQLGVLRDGVGGGGAGGDCIWEGGWLLEVGVAIDVVMDTSGTE